MKTEHIYRVQMAVQRAQIRAENEDRRQAAGGI